LVDEEELVEENILHRSREAGDVGDEVVVQLRWVLRFDGGEGKLARIVDPDAAADGPEEHHIAGLLVEPRR